MSGDSMRISLSLTSSPSSPRIPLTISPSTTTASSLHSLASEAASIPMDKIKLIFRGRLIPKEGDGNAVEEFLLEDGCVVHCMGKQQTAAVPSSSTSASASASASTVSPSVVRPPPTSTTPANAAPSTVNAGAATGGAVHPLKIALETMKSNHDATTYATGTQTLVKLLDNIISHPMEEKYRKVKRANPAFQKRLGRLSGSEAALASIGFTVQQQEQDATSSASSTAGEYVLVPSAEAWPKLLECQNILKTANSEAQRAKNVGAVGGSTNSSTSGMNAPIPPGMGAMGTPNIPSGAAGMADSLLQNPSQLRALLQNPMVRRMMENNPNIANNPMAQQSLDMIQQNPQMLEAAIQMMNSNPQLRQTLVDNASGARANGGFGTTGGANFDADAMRRQMEMMQAMSGSMGAGNGSTASSTAGHMAGSANQNNGSNTGNSVADSEMTEEEMIAEAIARSLRES